MCCVHVLLGAISIWEFSCALFASCCRRLATLAYEKEALDVGQVPRILNPIAVLPLALLEIAPTDSAGGGTTNAGVASSSPAPLKVALQINGNFFLSAGNAHG